VQSSALVEGAKLCCDANSTNLNKDTKGLEVDTPCSTASLSCRQTFLCRRSKSCLTLHAVCIGSIGFHGQLSLVCLASVNACTIIIILYMCDNMCKLHILSIQVIQGTACSESLHFVWLAISACLFHFVASPELHGRFKCCPDSHSTRVILNSCLSVCCTSATFTATAFPSHSPPFHFLCTSHILSVAFLPHLPLYPLVPICFPFCVVPIGHICCHGRRACTIMHLCSSLLFIGVPLVYHPACPQIQNLCIEVHTTRITIMSATAYLDSISCLITALNELLHST
jgi:hypothetical protein